MDDALESNDGEESSGDCGGGDGEQNEESQETASVAPTFSLEEEVSARQRLSAIGDRHAGMVNGVVGMEEGLVQGVPALLSIRTVSCCELRMLWRSCP